MQPLAVGRRRKKIEIRTGRRVNFEAGIWNRPNKSISVFAFFPLFFFVFFWEWLESSVYGRLGAPHLVQLTRDACTCNNSAFSGNRTARPVNFEEDRCNHPNKLTNPSPVCLFFPCSLSFVGNDWDHSYILLGICQTRFVRTTRINSYEPASQVCIGEKWRHRE